MQRTFPIYVVNFKNAYENLYRLYLTKGSLSLTNKNGGETPEFIQYAKAVKELIRVKMNTGCKKSSQKNNGDAEENQSSNRAMVESLRSTGGYNYYKIVYSANNNVSYTNISEESTEENADSLDDSTEIEDSSCDIDDTVSAVIVDEVLDSLFDEILRKDIEQGYFIKKADAQYAFNSITLCVHNELVDMCRKLAKPIPINPKNDNNEEGDNTTNSPNKNSNAKAHFMMVNLDDTVVDSEGDTASLGAITADPNRDTEYEAYLSATLEYGITSFVHEMVSYFINNNKPHYMISYLNNISGGTAIELYEDIYNNGFDAALKTIVERLRNIDINVEYLNNLHLNWKKNNKDIKKNYPNNWRDEAYKIVDSKVSKKNLF